MDRMRGTVTSVIIGRGFCFILGEDGISRFAHVRSFVNQRDFALSLEGKGVSFIPMDLNETGRMIIGNGLRAVDVKVEQHERT